jgi:hypothetical protein
MSQTPTEKLDLDLRSSETSWDLTLEASDAIRSRFLEEVESRYAQAMQAAFRRDDIQNFENLRQSRETVLESVFSGALEPWCIRHTDDGTSTVRQGRFGDATRRVRVVLRCDTSCSILYRFAATQTELEMLRGALETTAGATREQLQCLLRDPRLGLLAMPGANDLTRLKHAWAADAEAMLVFALRTSEDRTPRVFSLAEGRNSLRFAV